MVFTSCGWFGGLVSVVFGGFGLVWVGCDLWVTSWLWAVGLASG